MELDLSYAEKMLSHSEIVLYLTAFQPTATTKKRSAERFTYDLTGVSTKTVIGFGNFVGVYE
jgi:hypothetical protein